MSPHYGGPEGIRTLDLSDANRTLSQLSYGPIFKWMDGKESRNFYHFPDTDAAFRGVLWEEFRPHCIPVESGL